MSRIKDFFRRLLCGVGLVVDVIYYLLTGRLR